MARKRRSSGRRRASVVRRTPKRFTSRRRRTTRSPFGKLLPANILVGVAGGVAGFMGTQFLIDKFAPTDWRTGTKRIAAKAALGAGGYMVGRRMNAPFANAFAVGAGTSVGLDLIAKFMVKPTGVAGMGQGFTAGNLPGFSGGDAAYLAQAAAELGIN